MSRSLRSPPTTEGPAGLPTCGVTVPGIDYRRTVNSPPLGRSVSGWNRCRVRSIASPFRITLPSSTFAIGDRPPHLASGQHLHHLCTTFSSRRDASTADILVQRPGFRPSQKRSVGLDIVDYGAEVYLGVSPEEYVKRMTDSTTPTKVGMTDVEQVRKATAAIAASENKHGGGLSFASAKGQLEWATRLLKARASNENRRVLHEAIGNLSGVVAFSAFDMGNHDLAADSFVFAL